MRFTDAEISSTGAFLVGELERLDQELYAPLADFTWSRDIDLREDVTIADEVTSFMLANYAGGFGSIGGSGKSWIKGMDTTPARVSVETSKVTTPLTPWGMEVSYSIFELQKAMQVGRPIDVQKYDAMKFKHQLDIDQQVYMGDEGIGVKGLLNNDAVVAKSNLGSVNVKTMSAEDAVNLFNTVLESSWKATQYIRIPDTILIPPALFAALASKQLPNVDKNVLEYVLQNNIAVSNGGKLTIRPVKWLNDSSINSGNGRLVAYTKARDVVRFPLVQLQSMAPQFRDFMQSVPYYGALGGVEFVRPEMVYYGDLA
ncbi:hypothetical protein HMPREF3036_01408 [Sutterella sp. KLE1602]|jgi:hypothetical protein|uniref:Major capsid protein n=1 Tax=Myoviridae sp. ctK7P4 TaxID=2825080 RepID=A0A8S5QHJ0_9CAUD|nr:major capsid family protein [Sutterella sp. KLE1602]KXT34200.1 hypothetical protein HMPREF3036_01408 [Sutterella sp. KLE1602]DAE18774.1 MAG TPA: major capsid protein [Myoviridae sp. ctK7P4]